MRQKRGKLGKKRENWAKNGFLGNFFSPFFGGFGANYFRICGIREEKFPGFFLGQPDGDDVKIPKFWGGKTPKIGGKNHRKIGEKFKKKTLRIWEKNPKI